MKDIPGYEGLYAATKDGRIWSFKRGVYLSGYVDKFGYVTVSLYRGSTKNTRKVHRLVAQAFLDAIPDKPHVNHIDANKQNNNLTNLEWCDRKGNASHALRLGRYKSTKGIQNGAAKLNDLDVLKIRKMRQQGISVASIAHDLNISQSNIYLIISNQAWTHLPL